MKVATILLLAASALELDADKNRPVSRVVGLLKDMQKQIEKDQQEDEEVYERFACWCKVNDREKSQSISDAEESIARLGSKIEELTAQSGRLNTEVDNLDKEIAGNQQALDKATALRNKELASFIAEEKDLLQSITSLKSAITVLSKHHPSMLQEEQLLSIRAMLQNQLNIHTAILSAVITPSQRRIVQNFIQAPEYASQSGEIFGILNNMLDTFKANLDSSRKEEAESVKAFGALRSAKQAEIQAGQQQVDKKTGELADAQESNAQSKEDLEDTRNSLSADDQFLMSLKEKCKMTDEEWTQRQKTRQEEVQAISQAIGVLANDDARDNFSRTYNFLQLQRSEKKALRRRASTVLSSVAVKFHNPKIAQLATQVRLDAFTKVKKAIDDMISQLLVEKEDEVKHKDWCIENLNQNQSDTAKTDRDRQDKEATMDTLETQISQLTQEIDVLTKEISELEVQLKRAGEDREKQNAEFQVTLSDQREAKQMLNKALNFLKGFYEKKEQEVGLVQKQPAGPPPPEGFKSYKNNAGGNTVLSMLQQIIHDTEEMEKEAIHDEDESQKAYETFVQETNTSLGAKNTSKVNKSADRAQTETELSEAQDAHAGLVTELEQLANNNADIHRSCDFVLKNFDIRQQGRDEEVEALRQAKAILSGANFSAFLQRRL